MRCFLDSTGLTYLDDIRFLLPGRVAVRSTSAAVDLRRTWTVNHDPGPTQRSPLQALLGVTPVTEGDADALTGRLLDLAMDAYHSARPKAEEATGAEAVDAMVALVGIEADRLRSVVEMFAGDYSTALTLQAILRDAHPAIFADPVNGRPLLGVESDSFMALATWEAVTGAQAGKQLIECRHCGRPFLAAARTDEVYCRRTAPAEPAGGRTCQQVGPQAVFASNLSPLRALYRSEYRRLDKRVRRGQFERPVLDAWRVRAREVLTTAEKRRWSADRLRAAFEKIEPEVKQ